MKTINDYKLFQEILSLSQNQLKSFMKEFLRKKYTKAIARDKYLMAIGDIPVTLVAHLDTVFKDGKRILCYDKDYQIMWSPQGAGFDDRAGVVAIIKIIEQGYRPNIILCCDEESGGQGASALAKDFQELPFQNNFFIELDRAGHNDAVFYNCDNPEFINYIEKFGFLEQYGTFSDISILAPKFGAAAVNLSIGYESEHSYGEYLQVEWFNMTINKVINILKETDIPTFEYIESTSWLSWSWDEDKCDKCGHHYSEADLFPILTKDDKIALYCPDCIVSHVKWCKECGSGYEKDNAQDNGINYVCDRCKSKGGKK